MLTQSPTLTILLTSSRSQWASATSGRRWQRPQRISNAGAFAAIQSPNRTARQTKPPGKEVDLAYGQPLFKVQRLLVRTGVRDFLNHLDRGPLMVPGSDQLRCRNPE